MTQEISQLLRLNVEMEGLLRVLAEREHPEAAEALERKSEDFNAKVRALLDQYRPTVVKEDEAEAAEMPDSFDAVAFMDAAMTAPEAEAEELQEIPEPAAVEAEAPQQGAPVRPRVELSRVFSINDRYRYTHELFGGNMQRFQDALAAMSRMESFADVKAYLSEVLGLDLTLPIAKEFADRIASNMP